MHPGVIRFLLLGLLIGISSAECVAQQTPTPGTALPESLSEQVNDPTASLTQAQIEEFFTLSQFGTKAQPNRLQGRFILAVLPHGPLDLAQIVAAHLLPGDYSSKQKRLNPHRIRRLATFGSICDAAVDDGRNRFQMGNRAVSCLSHCDF